MQLQNDSSVCSLLRLQSFGEKTPAGNGYNSGYLESKPVADNLLDFCKSTQAALKNFGTGSYGSPPANASSIMAVCISKQPIAIGFLSELAKRSGGTITDVKSYGKYPHGITYFHFYPPALIETLAEVVRDAELAAIAKTKAASTALSKKSDATLGRAVKREAGW